MSEGRDQQNGTEQIRKWAAAMVITSRQDLGKMPGLRGLRGCRQRLWLTQGEVANRVGVSQITYMRWENCHGWPYAYYLPRLASALGVTMEELYLGPGGMEEETT